MSQHPRVTIGWAVASLETAITKLAHGPAERRVRDQFHQLLLALERARLPVDLDSRTLETPHDTDTDAAGIEAAR